MSFTIRERILHTVLKKNPRTLKIVFALCIVTTIGLLSVAYFKYRRVLDKPEQVNTAIQPGVDMAIDDNGIAAVVWDSPLADDDNRLMFAIRGS